MHKDWQLLGLCKDRENASTCSEQMNAYFCVCINNFSDCQDCENVLETTGPGQALARAHVSQSTRGR